MFAVKVLPSNVRLELVFKALVPLPIGILFAVIAVNPVPPLVTGSVPLMSDVDKSKASQDEFVPSVVKYLPLLPVCEGNASTEDQDVLVPLVLKNLPELPV